MAVIVCAVILTLFNIIMWIVFAAKFNKKFSTDDIIIKTRQQLNSMLSDINRNADRNINLINDRIKELKAVTAEAERRLSVLKVELEKTQKTQLLQTHFDQIKDIPKSKEEVALITAKKLLNSSTPLNRYQKEKDAGKSHINKSQNIEKLSDENSDMKVSLPKVTVASEQIVPKKDFNKLVKELAAQGKTVEEIASELDRSTQEVKFTLEIS